MIEVGQSLHHKRDDGIVGKVVSTCYLGEIPHYYIEVVGHGRKKQSILLSEWGLKLAYRIPKSKDTGTFSVAKLIKIFSQKEE